MLYGKAEQGQGARIPGYSQLGFGEAAGPGRKVEGDEIRVCVRAVVT